MREKASWKVDVEHAPAPDFTRWYMSRVTCGPLLLEVCRRCKVCPNLVAHLQIPRMRISYQVAMPVVGRPGQHAVPRRPDGAVGKALLSQGWCLAICLTSLLTDKQIQEGEIDLTSHYVDYAYRLTALQQQYQPPLFTSLRRHCGHNLHATTLIDPIFTNTLPTIASTTYSKETSMPYYYQPNSNMRKGTSTTNVTHVTSQEPSDKTGKHSQGNWPSCISTQPAEKRTSQP